MTKIQLLTNSSSSFTQLLLRILRSCIRLSQSSISTFLRLRLEVIIHKSQVLPLLIHQQLSRNNYLRAKGSLLVYRKLVISRLNKLQWQLWANTTNQSRATNSINQSISLQKQKIPIHARYNPNRWHQRLRTRLRARLRKKGPSLQSQAQIRSLSSMLEWRAGTTPWLTTHCTAKLILLSMEICLSHWGIQAIQYLRVKASDSKYLQLNTRDGCKPQAAYHTIRPDKIVKHWKEDPLGLLELIAKISLKMSH